MLLFYILTRVSKLWLSSHTWPLNPYFEALWSSPGITQPKLLKLLKIPTSFQWEIKQSVLSLHIGLETWKAGFPPKPEKWAHSLYYLQLQVTLA